MASFVGVRVYVCFDLHDPAPLLLWSGGQRIVYENNGRTERKREMIDPLSAPSWQSLNLAWSHLLAGSTTYEHLDFCPTLLLFFFYHILVVNLLVNVTQSCQFNYPPSVRWSTEENLHIYNVATDCVM